jgi:hypothetical protein
VQAKQRKLQQDLEAREAERAGGAQSYNLGPSVLNCAYHYQVDPPLKRSKTSTFKKHTGNPARRSICRLTLTSSQLLSEEKLPPLSKVAAPLRLLCHACSRLIPCRQRRRRRRTVAQTPASWRRMRIAGAWPGDLSLLQPDAFITRVWTVVLQTVALTCDCTRAKILTRTARVTMSAEKDATRRRMFVLPPGTNKRIKMKFRSFACTFVPSNKSIFRRQGRAASVSYFYQNPNAHRVPHSKLPTSLNLIKISHAAAQHAVKNAREKQTCQEGNVDLMASDTAALLLERNTHLREY